MKRSPLQLEWLSYPAASFRALPVGEDPIKPLMIKIAATVTYHLDSPHQVELTLSSQDDIDGAAYSISVEAIAAFRFDLDQARAVYHDAPANALPMVLAVNVTRIVYSAARELLATLTARAPHGSVLIDSILIGPEDVTIGSVEPQDKILSTVFGADARAPAKRSNKPRKTEGQAG
ncbi:hypothetical protein [Dokdonella sp.]|uniref:hypothetical protein n=1 Tax=Dokdonella sp. TaxID=2291710 RepID=UPI0031C5F5A7|nr:hypothetical protein [Dokdonella sp.]